MSKMKNQDMLIDEAARGAFGTSRTAARALGVCVRCRKPAIEFRDELSKREFAISQLCQSCQDDIFGALEALANEEG